VEHGDIQRQFNSSLLKEPVAVAGKQTRVLDVLGCNLGRHTGNSDSSMWFPLSLQGNVGGQATVASFQILSNPLFKLYGVMRH
jgi:hypothetical protein